MMLIKLIKNDLMFLVKYRIAFLYVVFTLLYLGILFAIPSTWRDTAGILMIFSDPAAMGLFFMGAIVLFEKSQRVLNTIAITPVNPYIYVLSKLFAIGIISLIVALILGFASGVIKNILFFTISIFLCSCLFSSLGLIISANATTLNDFILSAIPYQLIINIPAFAYILGLKYAWMLIHPGVAVIEIVQGGSFILIAFFSLILWTVAVTLFTCKFISKKLLHMGGIKL